MHVTITAIFYAGQWAGAIIALLLPPENNPLRCNSKPLISARLDQSVSKRRSPTELGTECLAPIIRPADNTTRGSGRSAVW